LYKDSEGKNYYLKKGDGKMFYAYYLGVVVASLLATYLMPQAMNNLEAIIDDEDIEGNEKILTLILIVSMSVSILLSWYTVSAYLIGRTRR
jgi:hypothetical protein